MANRALIAKAERAKAQRIELGNQEYMKADYMLAPKVTREELTKLCEGVKVKRVTKQAKVWRSVGPQARVLRTIEYNAKAKYAPGAKIPKGAGVCSRVLWLGGIPKL